MKYKIRNSFGYPRSPPPPPRSPSGINEKAPSSSCWTTIISFLAFGPVQSSKRKIPFPIFIYCMTFSQVVILIIMMSINGVENLAVNPSIGPSIKILRDWGAKDTQKIYDETQVYRFLSPCILHSGLIHLGVNVMWQLFLGSRCEVYWGMWRVFLIYLVSGVGGNLLSCVMNSGLISVGASSCLSGLFSAMFADLMYNWNNRITIPNPIFSTVTLIIQLVLFLAVGIVPLIDNWGHIGGLVVGFLLALVILPRDSVAKSQAAKEINDIGDTEQLLPTNLSLSDFQNNVPPQGSLTDLMQVNGESKTLRKVNWESGLRKIVILSRIISFLALLAYFALFFALFYTIVAKGVWTCKNCKYLDLSWLLYRL